MAGENRGYMEDVKKIEMLKNEISLLKKQIHLQKEILNQSPHYHLLVRSDGEILQVSDSVNKLLDKSKNDIIHQNLSNINLIPSDEYGKYLAAFQALSSGEKNRSFDTFFNSRNDSIPVSVHVSRVKSNHLKYKSDDKGVFSIYAYASNSVHLKETKETIQESENYYQAIFEYNGTATVVVEEDNTISLANSQTEHVFGFKPQEIMGRKKWTDFVLPEYQPQMMEFKKLRNSNSTSLPNQYEFQIFDRNGNKKDIFANICLIPGTKKTLASIIDVTEQKKALAIIREKENKYRKLAEAVEDFVFIINREDKLEYINNYAARKWKLNPDYVQGKLRCEIFPSENSDLQSKYLQRVFEIGNTVRGENLVTMTTDSMWLDTLLIPLKNKDGNVEKVLVVARDITERKEYELLLSRQNEIHKSMGTILTESIRSKNEEELLKTCLSVCEDITQSDFGFICEMNALDEINTLVLTESLQKKYSIKDFDLYPMIEIFKVKKIWNHLKTMKSPMMYNNLSKLDFKLPEKFSENNQFLKKLLLAPLLKNDEFVGMVVLGNKKSDYDFSDIKALQSITTTIVEALLRKRAEDNLKKALEDKEMLVKEIHHRTKNNLMIMASLLNLTSADIEDEKAREIFQQIQSRAKSMALIHEKLYRSDNFKEINFGDYIRYLARDLFNSFLGYPDRVQLVMELEDLNLDINTAIPLGLILNELLTNSMKYAFPSGEYGTITIKFFKEHKNYVMKVNDDGIGLPTDLDIQKTDTLGLQLVKNLIGQIEGEIMVETGEGTNITIKFPEDNNYLS
ncbi:MAG: PAS domain S-box protein [Methanobacteriaceae archaeon]|nr:PAS domain S-box protein [Methanobacteriaceae archaeon]